ncbi:FAD-dependent oxidoreductase [Micromonospora yangpuensis]|uniref:D-amino-acid oxidase n=1 Tax=Micromonospora yangpuensis TaxID=683228 RepID=A0A1C6UZ51_9ACTN|nr:FAD-dependent oxidoreductase [Micromonospora yangpuensis]GGL96021.1 amino acid oxidase [Micromonospora yangpuensis]SCL59348.1 D-amino-acid:oxygen oxidoreductase [Micromonospora yangpuensis]
MGPIDVVVVGGGIIGLTAAVRLQERGARVTVLAADDPERTVSTVAAAVWYPTHTDPDPRVLDWARRTYATLTRQAAEGVPGVVLRPTRMLLRHGPVELPWWAEATGDLVVRPAAPPYRAQLRFTAPTVEMSPYLGWLRERISAAGGRVLRHRVARLADAFVDPATSAGVATVVNATGLAAGRLAADPAVYPVRGHIVLVANPGLTTSVRDEDDPRGITYVHPRRHDVVLGGTYQPGRADLDAEPETAAAIRRRCVELVPELASARVLGERIGLRPARHGGPRVESTSTGVPGQRLVHAYGHGGAGVTLAWGVADEVARLAA